MPNLDKRGNADDYTHAKHISEGTIFAFRCLTARKKKKETGILALCILYHIQKVSIKAYAFVTDISRKQNSICMMGCWEKKKKEQKKIPTVKLFFP